jgi:hypothetical protein
MGMAEPQTELLPLRGTWNGRIFEAELVAYRQGVRHECIVRLRFQDDGSVIMCGWKETGPTLGEAQAARRR